MQARSPEAPLFRITRGTHSWEFPDWSQAGTDRSRAHTFGNRFDDPNGEYRVLYASSQLVSCYVETLARFRPDPKLLAELRLIAGEDDFQSLGVIPQEWFTTRYVGTAEVSGRFAALYTGEWVGHLRSRLQLECTRLGLPEFDLSTLIQAKERIVTQIASGIVYDLGGFAGIYYASRFGQELENWAIFEGIAVVRPLAARRVSCLDPELIEALQILRLDVPTTPAPL